MTTVKTGNPLLDLLEPGVNDILATIRAPQGTEAIDWQERTAAALSAAISAKRQADALESLASTLEGWLNVWIRDR